ncbi:MAG: calcium/sodium antiporter [Candidatus Omnitrophica bacterium]|nr:calcium/sodium antiporter [Candidatus Omnitrophota bacterium]
MLISFMLVLAGAALLYLGGESLVRGAVSMARAWGISPLVIGLTIVAFATSCPELCAALLAALKNQPEVALGAVVGSNIANIGLVLGLTAMIYPLTAQKKFILREVPIMILSGAFLLPICWGGMFDRWEGALLVLFLIGFLWYQVKRSKEEHEHHPMEKELEQTPPRMGVASLLIVIGVGLLVAGAHFLIEGAVDIARFFGVPERVIGLTLVAIGTSLPEIASSIVAAIRREPDLVLGNLVGSNIFNTLCILGVTTVICPITVNWSAAVIDLIVMLVITSLIYPFLLSGFRLRRREGGVMVLLYMCYIAYLFFYV